MPAFSNCARREAMALELVPRLAAFGPEAVVYIATGGEFPGRVIADALGVPLHGLDVRYPFSRIAQKAPRAVGILAWPLKELLYRAGAPRRGSAPLRLPAPGTRVILIDDSASSGRTISAALVELERNGLARRDICVAVLRCGRRARGLVDVWRTGAHPLIA